MTTETSSTRNLFRIAALLGALRSGPLPRPVLFERLAGIYPPGDSLRRMVDRDIERLAELGIKITRSNTRPPVYALAGGTPVFSDEELRTLALVRDSFGARHPQFTQVRALLDRLTGGLTARERRNYQRRQALRAPVEPAIDYSAYAPLFDELNAAIHARRRLSFLYRPLQRPQPTRHDLVEPLEIEYYDRHFYLVAYTSNGRQVFDFRIDRIRYDETFRRLDYLPPELLHARSLIATQLQTRRTGA
jgi:predicted DNA-binding transcriptional regulator YafY